MSRFFVLFLLVALAAGCATTQEPAPLPDTAIRFQAALEAGVKQQTQTLLAWHPDVAAALIGVMQGTCAVTGAKADMLAFQKALLMTIEALHIPEPSATHIRNFAPLLVGVVPLALQVAGTAVPGVSSAEFAVQSVCSWVVQTAQGA